MLQKNYNAVRQLLFTTKTTECTRYHLENHESVFEFRNYHRTISCLLHIFFQVYTLNSPVKIKIAMEACGLSQLKLETHRTV